jgi:Cdc6-like AAA superfamily ATPase
MSWWRNQASDVMLPALLQIPRRAERVNAAALKRTYVDVGPVTASLRLEEHQIIYGRRGTGKTHALGNLAETLRDAGTVVVMVDARQIGSAASYYSGSSESLFAAASAIIVDLLEALHSQLYDISFELMGQEFDVTRLVRHLDAPR